MSKKEKDIAFFVAFCIEEDYLSKCFEPLHTQGRQWLIAEIDEFIDIRKKKEA